MTIARICWNEAEPGETWALAFDAEDRPVRQYWDRWSDTSAPLGAIMPARLTEIAPQQGGVFLELESGEPVFLSTRTAPKEAEGHRLMVRVVSEARSEKKARVVKAQGEGPTTAFHAWLMSLPNAADIPLEPKCAPTLWQDVLSTAEGQSVALEQGGYLRIVPTPALVSVDVDRAGRSDKGRAAARARAINLDAARTLAREAALRDLGGALVLDCLAPISREAGAEIKKAFLDTFRQLSTRRAECLAPSPFGLMEIALAWGARPLHEKLGTPEALFLSALRDLLREANASPMATLTLALPAAAYQVAKSVNGRYDRALSDRYGARLSLAMSDRNQAEIIRS
ncbi:MAG: ribonuclease E/G [Pseudomonadota bacterium]